MASTAVTKFWVTVRDNVGRVAKTAVQVALADYNPTGAVGVAFKNIMLAIVGSNGNVEQISSIQSQEDSISATPAPRCNREDKITAVLLDANGQEHKFNIPTPSTSLSAVLGSSMLNISNTAVLAWASAMAAYACTSDGVAYTGQITTGRYIKHKTEKKGGY